MLRLHPRPATVSDFPLIFRNWSAGFPCLPVSLILQCHFPWNLLCSNHHCLSLSFVSSPNPPPHPLSLWQIPPCPASVVSSAASRSCDSKPSVRGLHLRRRSCCLHWCEGNRSQMLSLGWGRGWRGCNRATNTICITGKLSPPPLSITVNVTANVENEGRSIKRRQLWKQHPHTHVANQNFSSAYFLCILFASTYLVNLPPFDSNSTQ